MKAQWKLIVGLVIGVLVVGQAVSLRYVMAVGSDLDRAAAEVKICHDALDHANRDYQELINGVNAIRNNTTLSANDKEIVRLIGQAANVQKDLVDADSHAITAVQSILKHDQEGKK